jgi:hypothetical protein
MNGHQKPKWNAKPAKPDDEMVALEADRSFLEQFEELAVEQGPGGEAEGISDEGDLRAPGSFVRAGKYERTEGCFADRLRGCS